MARVFVTRRLPGDAFDRLADEHSVEIWEGRLQPSYATLREKAREVAGLLCLLTDRIDAPLIENCPELSDAQRAEVGEFLQSLDDHDDVHRVWAAMK